MENKKTYWLSPQIKWITFKTICDKFPDSGPTPKNANKMLWEMLRDRQINIFLENSDDPIRITTKNIPKKAIIIK